MSLREAATFTLVGVALSTVAFALSSTLCALARRWGPRFGLVDFPGGPLRHRIPVSLAGGVAIWFATMVMLGLGALDLGFGGTELPFAVARHVDGLWYRAGELAVILGLSTAALGLGLIDDLFGLTWKVRLGAQVALAVALATWGTRVTLFPPISYPLVGGLITVLWVVGITNAFIFLDNMDGLAAGVGIIASLLFAVAQMQVGSLFAPAVLIVLAGVLGGFFVHNRYPARLFMGDSGSTFLGFLLGAMTVSGTYYRYDQNDSPWNVLSPLLVMAVPLYEAVSVFIIWLGDRHDPFTWNRRHFSYRLLDFGMTPPRSVEAILLVSLSAGLGAPLLHRLDAFGAILILGQSACLMGVVAILEVSAVRRSTALEHEREPAPKPTDVVEETTAAS